MEHYRNNRFEFFWMGILAFFLSKKEYEKVSKKGGYYVNIIIYDDSEKDRERLKKLIRQYEPHLDKDIVITEYSSGERGDLDDLIADIHQNRQELLYRFVEGEKRLRIENIMYNGKELSVPKSRYQEVKKQYANHLDLSRKVE